MNLLLTSRSIFFPLSVLSVLDGSHSVALLEESVEVLHIIVSDLFGDLLDALAGFLKKGLGSLESFDPQYVLEGRRTYP